jgi:hypothetical protein
MTLIALEEHVLPPDHINEVWATPMASVSITAKLVDVGEQRLRVMDEAGVDTQVLSVVAPGSQQVPAEHAADLSSAINDRCAETVATQPRRFNALATLPSQDPGAAITPIARLWRRLSRTRAPHHLRLYHHSAAAVRHAGVRCRPHYVLQRLSLRRPRSACTFSGRSPDQLARPGQDRVPQRPPAFSALSSAEARAVTTAGRRPSRAELGRSR